MNERDAPYGNYSEAIPMEKLISLTHEKLLAHANYSDEHIREYAHSIVESELCPCASSAKNIVDALVIEFLRDVKR
ncbi:MAG: hypothetical protein ACI9US_004338 [Gammaproteobacteria bacterium]|jgi:hypothetical protein